MTDDNQYWDVHLGRLSGLLTSHVSVAIVSAAAQLGIADVFDDRPLTSAEVAERCGTDPDMTRRLMAGMDEVGLLADYDDDLYELSDTGRLLREDHPKSLKNWAAIQTELMMPLMSGLAHSVRTGERSDTEVFGAPFYDYLAANPELNDRWNKAMGETLRAWLLDLILEVFDWSSVSTVVDIGGAAGDLAVELCSRFPSLRVTVADSVTNNALAQQHAATKELQRLITAPRPPAAVPAGDVALLVRVGLNHPTGELSWLASLRSSHLVVVDTGGTQVDSMHDAMLAPLGGRCRRTEEWTDMLGQLGWCLTAKTTKAAWHAYCCTRS